MNQSIKAMYKKMNNNEINMQIWWDFIATQDKAEVREVVEIMGSVQRRLKSFLDGFHHTTKIRQFCNEFGYSDVEPYEVVKVISANCVEVREMATKQIVFPSQFFVGGFSAHCADNFNQKYEYTSDPCRPTIRIRKGKKGWGNGKFRMANHPHKHYDYNF
jgi:hypothetical protein